MGRKWNIVFTVLVQALTALSVLALAFVIYFIVREALPTFQEVSLTDFLFGSRWMPVDYVSETSFGIFNFIMATLYVSFVAMVLAVVVSLGAALFLSCVASPRARSLLYPFVDLLAGIPSVVYGFVGLTVLVKLLLKAGVRTGSCVLAAAIVLAVMLLPYLVSSCSETMLRVKERYCGAADALGVDRWHFAATVILPASWRNILLAMILAIGRAMGETMAVMMVMGNANLFPRLLGKSESIASVIALEMGTAVVGSTHYHALYAAGLVLMVLLFLIHGVIGLLRKRLLKEGGI
ncbi:MAG: phosphate ABC transporter permease subunit PstC [Oscillospiraceae bacterium]